MIVIVFVSRLTKVPVTYINTGNTLIAQQIVLHGTHAKRLKQHNLMSKSRAFYVGLVAVVVIVFVVDAKTYRFQNLLSSLLAAAAWACTVCLGRCRERQRRL